MCVFAAPAVAGATGASASLGSAAAFSSAFTAAPLVAAPTSSFLGLGAAAKPFMARTALNFGTRKCSKNGLGFSSDLNSTVTIRTASFFRSF